MKGLVYEEKVVIEREVWMNKDVVFKLLSNLFILGILFDCIIVV